MPRPSSYQHRLVLRKRTRFTLRRSTLAQSARSVSQNVANSARRSTTAKHSKKCRPYGCSSGYTTRRKANGVSFEKMSSNQHAKRRRVCRSSRNLSSVSVDSLQTMCSDSNTNLGSDEQNRIVGNKFIPRVIKEEIVEEEVSQDETKTEVSTMEQVDEHGSENNTESLEARFRKIIRLYRYMMLPDVHDKIRRPAHKSFLRRNLSYMKSDTARSSYSPTAELTKMEKSDHLISVITAIRKRKELVAQSLKGNTQASIPSVATVLRKMVQTVWTKSATNNYHSKEMRGHPHCAEQTSMIKFIDVRNNELPGNRHAIITVYLSSETDGVFGEIIRLPSATVQMQINSRCLPVDIDLPALIGCPKFCRGRERNDYMILKVIFSREKDARVSGGRTLRGIPQKNAEKETKAVSRRLCLTRSPEKSEGCTTMYGARLIASVLKRTNKDGLIYGDGSITLIPESVLDLRPNWRADRGLTRKLIGLCKKMHVGPFVRMSIVQDNSGETSSSDDDDESKSFSSYASASTVQAELTGNANHPSGKQLEKMSIVDSVAGGGEAGFDEYMRARFKRELLLEFPKLICYRFITRFSVETEAVFPDKQQQSPKEINQQLLEDDYAVINGQIAEQINEKCFDFKFVLKEVKVEQELGRRIRTRFVRPSPSKRLRRRGSPLKEVSPGRALIKRVLLDAQRPIKQEKLDGKQKEKFRLDVPRRDVPLSETVDYLAARYDKCAKVTPPKRVDVDDRTEDFSSCMSLKITVPELHYEGYPEPDGNGAVTRFLSPANKCFFCFTPFPDMFALLLHMRTSYPRLEIIYRGDIRQTAFISTFAPVFLDVYVRKNFDVSHEFAMMRQFVAGKHHGGPARCTPNDRLTYIVHKAEARAMRSVPKDLSIFFTQFDKNRRAIRGNNVAYFGFRSRHPLVNSCQVSTKQTDQEWLREMIIRKIEDFLDLSREEKDFMSLWSIFLLNLNNRPMGRCQTYRTCRQFLQKHLQDLCRLKIQREWVLHLSALHRIGALDTDEVYDLSMRLQDYYDPNKDVRHIVYTTRMRQEAGATTTSKKDPPAWQKEPVLGPKVASLRSSSFLRAMAEQNSDNEELFKKFMNDPLRKEQSTNSMEETARCSVPRRHREPDCTKYLAEPPAAKPPDWLSYAE